MNEYEALIYSDELTHYGVLGMKWGIRRYQNKDGTLTDAGKRRIRNSYRKYRSSEDKYLQTFSKEDDSKALKNFKKLSDNLQNTLTETGYHIKTRQIVEECDKNFEKLNAELKKESKDFNKVVYGIDDACILQEACEGSYEDFLKEMNSGRHFISKDHGETPGWGEEILYSSNPENVYKYGHAMAENEKKMFKALSDLNDITVKEFGLDSSEEDDMKYIINQYIRRL